MGLISWKASDLMHAHRASVHATSTQSGRITATVHATVHATIHGSCAQSGRITATAMPGRLLCFAQERHHPQRVALRDHGRRRPGCTPGASADAADAALLTHSQPSVAHVVQVQPPN
eukprot:269380-Chlamydomonas_euryale.AAC.4